MRLLLALALVAGAGNPFAGPFAPPGAFGRGAAFYQAKHGTKPGSLFTTDGNTVAHVYFNGTALVDSKGNAWTMHGTVPMVPASGKIPPGAGPFSTLNYYDLAVGTPLHFSGDFTMCAAWRNNWTIDYTLIGDGTYNVDGYRLTVGGGGTGVAAWNQYSGADNIANAAGDTSIGGITITCFGRSSGQLHNKTNAAGEVNTGVTSVVAATGQFNLGLDRSGGAPANAIIYEIWASSTPYNTTNATAQISHACAALGGCG